MVSIPREMYQGTKVQFPTYSAGFSPKKPGAESLLKLNKNGKEIVNISEPTKKSNKTIKSPKKYTKHKNTKKILKTQNTIKNSKTTKENKTVKL